MSAEPLPAEPLPAEPLPAEPSPTPAAVGPKLFEPPAGETAGPAAKAAEPRSLWRQHLVDAEGGVKQAVRGDSVFFVQLFAAATVIALATTLGLGPGEWALLIAAGAGVTAVEIVRQAIRVVAGVSAAEFPSESRRMLRLATAATAVSVGGAATVTGLLLGARLWGLFGPGG